ncbi:hypothetical protein HDU67_004111, partial [Dinochytrium kinnereticum]
SVQACKLHFKTSTKAYTFSFSFKSTPVETVTGQASSIQSTSAPVPRDGVSPDLVYSPTYDAATHTGSIKAVAKSYADCLYLRRYAYLKTGKGFCDGLPKYEPESGRSLSMECIDGFNAVADRCVLAIDAGKEYQFNYTFTAKKGAAVTPTAPSAPEATEPKPDVVAPAPPSQPTMGLPPRDGVSPGLVYSPTYDAATHTASIKAVAKSYPDCLYLRRYAYLKSGKGFCDGLPEYEPESGRSLSMECINGFNAVADRCVLAIDAGKEYQFNYTFTAKKGAAVTPTAPSAPEATEPKPDVVAPAPPSQPTMGLPPRDGVSPGLVYSPTYDAATHTASIKAVAKSYPDCLYLRRYAYLKSGKGFCDGLPEYEPESGRSLSMECIDGFNAVADRCVLAIDGGKQYQFIYSFTAKKGSAVTPTAPSAPEATEPNPDVVAPAPPTQPTMGLPPRDGVSPGLVYSPTYDAATHTASIKAVAKSYPD